jgi:60 kDa SS-A/Ro ribonucleoprotein
VANKSIFKSRNGSRRIDIPITDTTNKAGGTAYDLGSEGALAQYAVTGCLNQTFYANAEEQVEKIMELANQCCNEFIAKTAIYAHEKAHMKDVPALLLNILANREESGLQYLRLAFPRVVTNTKMLRNFVQILRSGKCGRKSMGSAVRNLVRDYLSRKNSDSLLYDSIGNNPSLADIVKMVHPKPESREKEAFYAWLLKSKKLTEMTSELPNGVRKFEDFKAGRTSEIPPVEFRMLTALPLSREQWKAIALRCSWNQIRMNLNTFERHGVLNDNEVIQSLIAKLCDESLVGKANAFPYQLLTTYQATVGKIPAPLSNALQIAMESATKNVPEIAGSIAICLDVSGSMGSPITGHRASATTVTRCVDVAALFSACLLRKNKNALILPFDTMVRRVVVNPFDSVMTNAQKLACNGGGTDCHVALAELNRCNWVGNAVIFVSDNESWYSHSNNWGGRGTPMMQEWAKLKIRRGNESAKLVCIDIQAGSTTQAPDSKDRFNVGGFSDSVFTAVANFLNNDNRDFASIIKSEVKFE